MKMPAFQNGFAMLGLVMVVSTITVIGVVAFRALDAQDNTQVATQVEQPATTKEVASLETPADIQAVTAELESAEAELNALDAELSAEFNF